jgi:hypothetical protein|tara:strand:- start:1093 stop:1407 length:315 start_codon:yes stop_codon:yes gene_type:complete
MLDLGLALTLHLAMDKNYNEFHPYMKFAHSNYNVGAFYNSEKRISYFTSTNINLDNNVDVEIGLVSGYRKGIMPLIRLRYGTFFMMPGIENDNVGIVIGKEIKF